MKSIYLFSGLGADERAFQQLDFSEYSATFIKWMVPIDKESIESYALHLSTQITTPNPILIGLSFGGIMAVEVAKLMPVENVILISSVLTRNELPFYFRWAGRMRLHKLVPMSILKSSSFFSNWIFGLKTPFEKQLLKAILDDTNEVFLRWAIDAIVTWSNHTRLQNSSHIHGAKDRILPICFTKPDFTIAGGGHFMVLNKAGELMQIIKGLI